MTFLNQIGHFLRREVVLRKEEGRSNPTVRDGVSRAKLQALDVEE